MKEKILVFKDEKGDEHDYNHIIALLSFRDDDSYNLTSVIVNNEFVIKPKGKKRYPFRSQGNYYILFASENGAYFYKGFDGHKGNVFYDSNSVMEDLVVFLNDSHLNKGEKLKLAFDYELLGMIEKYFNSLNE